MSWRRNIELAVPASSSLKQISVRRARQLWSVWEMESKFQREWLLSRSGIRKILAIFWSMWLGILYPLYPIEYNELDSMLWFISDRTSAFTSKPRSSSLDTWYTVTPRLQIHRLNIISTTHSSRLRKHHHSNDHAVQSYEGISLHDTHVRRMERLTKHLAHDL